MPQSSMLGAAMCAEGVGVMQGVAMLSTQASALRSGKDVTEAFRRPMLAYYVYILVLARVDTDLMSINSRPRLLFRPLKASSVVFSEFLPHSVQVNVYCSPRDRCSRVERGPYLLTLLARLHSLEDLNTISHIERVFMSIASLVFPPVRLTLNIISSDEAPDRTKSLAPDKPLLNGMISAKDIVVLESKETCRRKLDL